MSSDASASPSSRAAGKEPASPALSDASSVLSPTPRRSVSTNGGLADSNSSDVTALRQEVARLQLLLQASEAKVAMWEECMQSFLHSVMLSPDMNEMYKDECSTLLRDALKTVEQIQTIKYIDCSFPSVPTEAPHIQLIRWESMQYSEWQVRWAPSWKVQVAVEGLQYLQFTLMLRLFDFRISGRMVFRASNDLSEIKMMFLAQPKMRLKTECSVSWGSVPLPLQTYIETVVQDELKRWTKDNVVTPHEMAIRPQSFQPKKGLNEADVERAIRATQLARQLAAVNMS